MYLVRSTRTTVCTLSDPVVKFYLWVYTYIPAVGLWVAQHGM